MYSRSSEPVQFERDCAAVLVPQGELVTLPAGSYGYITQALGGSYTVFVEGNLMRIAGRDADDRQDEAQPPDQVAGVDERARDLLGEIQMPKPIRAVYGRDYQPLEKLALESYVVHSAP